MGKLLDALYGAKEAVVVASTIAAAATTPIPSSGASYAQVQVTQQEQRAEDVRMATSVANSVPAGEERPK